MLTNPQIAKITAVKKMSASHHGMWITSIPSGRQIVPSPQDRVVANGIIYIGSNDDEVYAFGLPGGTTGGVRRPAPAART
jgi:hypothetical protein